MDSISAASESAPSARGQFADGVSARLHDAKVAATPDGLSITWSEGQTLWPWKKIVRREAPRGQARLGLGPTDAARLTLSDDDWLRLSPGKLGDARVHLGREALVGLGLMAAAGLVLGALFLVWPIASDGLARIAPLSVEERMGEAAEEQVQLIAQPCPGAAGEAGSAVLTEVAGRLASHSDARFPIKVTIVRMTMPNAFALPGGAIYVTSGLIDLAESPDEVAAVIGHEVGHVAARHVVKGAIRAVGLGAAVDLIVGGGTGAAAPIAAGVINVTALRYSRDDESEADSLGLSYMDEEGLDPSALARFFARMTKREKIKDGPDVPEFLSSHPDSGRRARLAQARAHPGAPPALTPAEWASVKAACR